MTFHDLSHIDPPKDEVKRKSRSRTHIVLFAIIASILIHLSFITLTALFKGPENNINSKTPMQTQLVSLPPQKKENSAAPQKPVVNVAPPKEAVKPKKADYLAEHNQSVKEQTRARETSLKSPRANAPVPQKPKREPEIERATSNNGLLAKPAEKQRPSPKNLVPTWKDQENDTGIAFSEHLAGVKSGAETRLNTLESVHATFFNRVKEAVARRWSPNSAIRRHDPMGKKVGTTDRMTQVMATINRSGELIAIKLSRESGVYFLDDEALKAFKEAAPFPNPPGALFANNDSFEFPFGFMLSYNRGFKFDLDWRPY